MSLLSIDRVTAGYRGGFSLSDISLDVESGEMVGIIGPNGSGKSTLLSTILSDLPLLSGEILLEGRALGKLSRRERARRIAVVPQRVERIGIPVEEYVAMGRLPHHSPLSFFSSPKDREVVDHYLSLVALDPLRKRNMTELSGGEQQMAAIALALSVESSLLLLDEATSHLDISHAMRILDLVSSLAKRDNKHPAVVAVLHDLSLASQYCDRLVLMSEGQLIAQGTPDEVLTAQHIRSVYQTEVTIAPHPVSGRPMVLPFADPER